MNTYLVFEMFPSYGNPDTDMDGTEYEYCTTASNLGEEMDLRGCMHMPLGNGLHILYRNRPDWAVAAILPDGTRVRGPVCIMRADRHTTLEDLTQEDIGCIASCLTENAVLDLRKWNNSGDETITTACMISAQKRKGGEKGMASEWEELEKLTKEELIIELVRERTAHRDFLSSFQRLMFEHPIDRVPPYVVETEEDDALHEGQRTTDEWARRIALYAKPRSECPEEFGYTDMFEYGINHDQADEVFDRMAEEGILDWDTADPRSRRFSGIAGYYADEVAEMSPEERERLRKEREGL